MGFLDKAKAAALDLQAKADTALSNGGMMGGNPMGGPGGGGGQADRLLRDLGVLTFLNAVGTPGSADDYNRIMDSLQQLRSAGQLNLSLSPVMGAPGGPPPPPGAVKAAYAAGQPPAAPPSPAAAGRTAGRRRAPSPRPTPSPPNPTGPARRRPRDRGGAPNPTAAR
jgi:hypothetical protein